MSVYDKLMKVQQELKVPKSNFNSFGEYKYRSAEDILEAVKPLLAKYKATMFITDDMRAIEGRFYLEANYIRWYRDKRESSCKSFSKRAGR